MLRSIRPDKTIKLDKVAGVTSVDDLLKVIQTVLANGAKITVTIEGTDPEPDEAASASPAKCPVCGWKSDRSFKSESSRSRALRAHKAHCKGIDASTSSLMEWIQSGEQK